MQAVFKIVDFWPVKLINEADHRPNKMPNSSEAHRLGIGIFHPVLMEILKKKVERSTRAKNSDSYSPYSHWDVFHGLAIPLRFDNILCSSVSRVDVCLYCCTAHTQLSDDGECPTEAKSSAGIELSPALFQSIYRYVFASVW